MRYDRREASGECSASEVVSEVIIQPTCSLSSIRPHGPVVCKKPKFFPAQRPTIVYDRRLLPTSSRDAVERNGRGATPQYWEARSVVRSFRVECSVWFQCSRNPVPARPADAPVGVGPDAGAFPARCWTHCCNASRPGPERRGYLRETTHRRAGPATATTFSHPARPPPWSAGTCATHRRTTTAPSCANPR